MQMQHTQPLVAPVQAPNAFGPGMAMAPMAQQGLISANQANNGAGDSSGCSSNDSSLLFIQQVIYLAPLIKTLQGLVHRRLLTHNGLSEKRLSNCIMHHSYLL